MNDSKDDSGLGSPSPWTARRFVATNAEGNAGELLRTVAAQIDALGSVEVEDIIFGSYATSDEIHMTVYFSAT